MFTFKTTNRCEWALLTAHLPRLRPQAIGILLRDLHRDQFHFRMRAGWWSVLSEDDEPEIWPALSEDLERRAREMGAKDLLDWLESTASHAFQISTRREIRIRNVEATLDCLYHQYVVTEPYDSLAASLEKRNLIRLEHIGSAGEVISQARAKRFLYDNRWHHAVLSATLIFGVIIAQIKRHPTTEPARWSKTQASEPIVLPLFSALAYRPLLLQIDSEAQLSLAEGRRRRKRHMNAVHPPHKRFQSGFLGVRVQEVRTPAIDCPPPQLLLEVNGAVSPLPFPIPSAPRFRSRPFIRAVSVFLKPFRKLRSRSKT